MRIHTDDATRRDKTVVLAVWIGRNAAPGNDNDIIWSIKRAYCARAD